MMYEIAKTLVGVGVSSMCATGAVTIFDHIAEPVLDDKHCGNYEEVCIFVLEIVGSAIVGGVCGYTCMTAMDLVKSIF